MSTLKRNLAYLIRKHGTNPTQLAKATGVPQPTIKRILDGTSDDPRTNTLEPLANYFECSVEYLRTADIEGGDQVFDAIVKNEGTSIGVHLATEDVAERNTTAERSRGIPPIQIQLARNFAESLPVELRQNIERRVSAQGHSYRFDYFSKKMAVELGTLVIRQGAGGVRSISTSGITRSLWRLSSYRLLTNESHPDRAYLLFVSIINETDGPLPVKTMTRIGGEAALHGIDVVWGDVKSAAAYVTSMENGTMKVFYQSEGALFDEDETF